MKFLDRPWPLEVTSKRDTSILLLCLVHVYYFPSILCHRPSTVHLKLCIVPTMMDTVFPPWHACKQRSFVQSGPGLCPEEAVERFASWFGLWSLPVCL